ncbi:MAG TPA: histidine phosphatase family protein [Bacteroidales bacterium]|nr:histidine phosphatase family protein [Bacteroidales bacterium]HPI87486.1 histidine phosphatase family protein [Bacteroidales bacterium]
MKTIYIVRHAKSSWNQADLPDERRPLMEKGKKRTKKIIDKLHEMNIHVDYIISSHAVRALETAKLLAHALNYPNENIKIDPHIYFTDGDGIINQFFDIPERFRSVMIVGHNPALTDFINQYLKEPIENLPTSGIVGISFETDKWEEIPLAKHHVDFLLFPKEI